MVAVSKWKCVVISDVVYNTDSCQCCQAEKCVHGFFLEIEI